MSLREDAKKIMDAAIRAADPYENTARILSGLRLPERVAVFSIGKAAIPMAQAAADVLGARIAYGLAVTKYDHTGSFASPYFTVIEAAHPVSDDKSILAAETAMAAAGKLSAGDAALVLLSGGGSALFEASSVPPAAQRDVTEKLLARGAPIHALNAVRKRLSLVKGGKFAACCYPAKVITVALSDVLGDDKGVIASGVTVADDAPDETLREIAAKYLPDAPEEVLSALYRNDALKINDGGYEFAGNIHMLCAAAVKEAERLGYSAHLLTEALTGEAREQPEKLLRNLPEKGKVALICGGETTVTLRGSGKGGRNQEMALSAAILLEGTENVLFASVGSDGTDGPTDAAGGVADGGTAARMRAAGTDPAAALKNNDAYHALKAAGDLIVTGPTGTNVNDLTILLADR